MAIPTDIVGAPPHRAQVSEKAIRHRLASWYAHEIEKAQRGSTTAAVIAALSCERRE